jgi:hypothetical protein
VYEAAGYVEMAKKQPVMASYQHCCRANIFRRDQGNVTDFEAFKSILRYNDWQNDPYSEGHPGASPCRRLHSSNRSN